MQLSRSSRYNSPVVIFHSLQRSLFTFTFPVLSLFIPHYHHFRRRVWLSKASWTVWKQKSWSTERSSTTCKSWTMTPSFLKKLPRWTTTFPPINLQHTDTVLLYILYMIVLTTPVIKEDANYMSHNSSYDSFLSVYSPVFFSFWCTQTTCKYRHISQSHHYTLRKQRFSPKTV